MEEEFKTPSGGIRRKQDDRTPNSDMDSPEVYNNKSCIDSNEIVNLKEWFQEQLDSIREDFRAGNLDLKREIQDLRQQIEAKDTTIVSLEGNVASYRAGSIQLRQ
jgi:hypothetical protein